MRDIELRTNGKYFRVYKTGQTNIHLALKQWWDQGANGVLCGRWGEYGTAGVAEAEQSGVGKCQRCITMAERWIKKHGLVWRV